MVVPVNVAPKPQRERAQTMETLSLGPKTRFGEYPELSLLRTQEVSLSRDVRILRHCLTDLSFCVGKKIGFGDLIQSLSS